jgi:uncharacterized tellurite resistance protein B-like protein
MSDEFEELMGVVQKELGTADPEWIQIVAAVAGLLVTVAYADREHSEPERQETRRQLTRIEGLGPAAVEAVMTLLERHVLPLATLHVQRFTRILREYTSEDARFQLLDVLLAVAAADGVISHDEIVSLRNLTNALGLSQQHYNQLQEQYKAQLHFA